VVAVGKAKEFVTWFSFLLDELDQEALEDLAKLYTDFAHLAVRLWKIRTTIRVLEMPQLADSVFQFGSHKMEGEATAASSLGWRLNGRPIAVVIRPLIISEPVVLEDMPPQEVIWSKTLVWVSGRGEYPLGDEHGDGCSSCQWR
jgi:hypothetical protein